MNQKSLGPSEITPAPCTGGMRQWALILATILSIALAGAGGAWLWMAWGELPAAPPPNAVIQMDDARFAYDPGWTVNPTGADPSEPDDPWHSPAGTLTFDYKGRDLALNVAVGNYWAYLLITVDGVPANQLPTLPGVLDSQGASAAYRPLLVPEAQTDAGPSPHWILVHRAQDDGPHRVQVEVWRGWSQFPLRGVAIDALPTPPPPVWPGIALVLAAGWVGIWFFFQRKPSIGVGPIRSLAWPTPPAVAGPGLLIIGMILIATGTVLDVWPVVVAGLGMMGLAGIMRPALWLAGLLSGLPFYLYPLPILPGRSLNLVEIGLYAGLLILTMRNTAIRPSAPRRLTGQAALLGLLISIALIAAFATPLATGHLDVALREWRTVFLAGGLFALLMAWTLATSPDPGADGRLLILAWVAGGTAIATVGLLGYVNERLVVDAEGVQRLRSLYGSPNNLALYLERTALVGGALALFGTQQKVDVAKTSTFLGLTWDRWLWIGLTVPQLIALILTFSKGALVLGLPAGIGVLGIGGWLYVGRRGLSKRPLLWLGIGVAVMGVALLPFLGAERFQRVLDVGQGSTGFFRVQLWRSAWRMALDHPLWGVGPDNFLYTYRSGYILPAAWQEPNLNHPHNILLDLWTRIGLPGLLVAAVWLGMGVRRLLAQFRTGQGTSPVLALGVLAAIAAALAHGTIDVSYALPDLMLVWVLMGFGAGSEDRTAHS